MNGPGKGWAKGKSMKEFRKYKRRGPPARKRCCHCGMLRLRNRLRYLGGGKYRCTYCVAAEARKRSR